MSLRRMTLTLFTVLAVAIPGVLAGANPAAAHHQGGDWLYAGGVHIPRTPFHNKWEFTERCGDLELSVAGHNFGVYSDRYVAGGHGQAFLAWQRNTWREVWTNVDTGDYFTVGGHTVFRENRAKYVPNWKVPDGLVPQEGLVGPVFLFRSSERGTFFKVTRSDGTQYSRDAGLLLYSSLYDTLGDHTPGGTELDFRIVKQVGHFPLFDTDICEIAQELVG